MKGVFNHKLVITSSIAVGVSVSIGAYLAITPVYEASTTLLVGQISGGDDWEAAKRSTELIASHARIAESEEVIRDAIETIGLDGLGVEPPSPAGGLGERLRSLIPGSRPEARRPISRMDNALFQIGKAIVVTPEPRSNVIRIAFKHSDPTIAASFANILAQSFIDRQIKLSGKPGTLDFFRVQKGRFDAEVERRSAEFETFVKQQRAYSIVDQRTLLLKRASEIAAALSITRTSLAEKQGQRSALVSQLKLLRPVTQSPFVSSVVDALGNDERNGNSVRSTAPLGDRTTGAGDPPLLMVRVYQDEMVALFKVNADIKGLRDLTEQQQTELGTVNAELATLVENQTEFEKLKREVGLATFNAELYAKRTVAEQIDSDLRTAKLSNIKVIQPALVPMQVSFPNARVFLAAGALGGAMIGVASALLLESAPKGTSNAPQDRQPGALQPAGSSPVAPRDRKPSSRRWRQAQPRKLRRSSDPGTDTLGTSVATSERSGSQAPRAIGKTRSLRAYALACLLGLALAVAATAAGVHDTRAADQLLEWARANWMMTTPIRG